MDVPNLLLIFCSYTKAYGNFPLKVKNRLGSGRMASQMCAVLELGCKNNVFDGNCLPVVGNDDLGRAQYALVQMGTQFVLNQAMGVIVKIGNDAMMLPINAAKGAASKTLEATYVWYKRVKRVNDIYENAEKIHKFYDSLGGLWSGVNQAADDYIKMLSS